MTFAATANVVLHVGAKPVFADVDARTMNLDPEELRSTLEERGGRVKGIIVVHLCGRPCEMSSIWEIAGQWGTLIFEDAAHATEAWYGGKKIGKLGDGASFSFYVNKNLMTGEGGMVTTDREDWAKKVRLLSLHGMSKGAWKRYSIRKDVVRFTVIFSIFVFLLLFFFSSNIKNTFIQRDFNITGFHSRDICFYIDIFFIFGKRKTALFF